MLLYVLGRWDGETSRENLLGPYIYDDKTVNGSDYRNMLIIYTFPNLAPLRSDNIFMQDVSPANYSNRLRQHFDLKCQTVGLVEEDLPHGHRDLRKLLVLNLSFRAIKIQSLRY